MRPVRVIQLVVTPPARNGASLEVLLLKGVGSAVALVAGSSRGAVVGGAEELGFDGLEEGRLVDGVHPEGGDGGRAGDGDGDVAVCECACVDGCAAPEFVRRVVD